MDETISDFGERSRLRLLLDRLSLIGMRVTLIGLPIR
jgi:hypothetical protein